MVKTEAKKLLSSGEAVNFDPTESSKRKKKRKNRVDHEGVAQMPTKSEEENNSQMDDDTTRRHSDSQKRKRKKPKDDSDQMVQQTKKKVQRKEDKSTDVEGESRGEDVELPQKVEMETPGEDTGEEQEEQEQLSPEEARKMERKMKKLRKKEAKKSALPQEPVKEEEKKESVAHLGSVYLQTWKSDRPSWVFRKVRQVWLLRNMYNTDKVSDEDFPILLEYLTGLQGKGRETTVAEAEKLLQAQEHKEGEEEGTGETLSGGQLERVRQVLQVLV
ncbi:C7orf50 [Branchiostoma lanceolatum]|uniref:C7orf50 protein n=1 Tax=Branchiostoma lanceolatum TaxID=7740 RepID=A0A8K0F301_BRALA|nr:C7orf50 [Branchiostoma lanceolatum]